MSTTAEHGGTASLDPDRPTRKLTGKLGTFDIVFTVLAFNGPFAGFVGFSPVIIGSGNTLAAPVMFIVAGVVLLLFTVGFTAMGRHLPNPGGFYAYITAGLGKPLGLGASFLALLTYLAILSCSYVYGGIGLDQLITQTFHGPDMSEWILALVLVVVVAVLGYFEISLSAKVLTVLLCVEVVVIVAFNLVTFATGGAEGNTVTPFSPHNIFSGNLGLAVLFGFLCFGGFEATAIFREEARDPEKTIPRATYIAVLVLTVLYAVTTWALVVAVGPSTVIHKTAADPVGTAMGALGSILGHTIEEVVTALLCTSIFAAVLSIHNVAARYMYSLSVDRVFPAVLSRVHAKHGSPYVASIVTSVISVIVILAALSVGVSPSRVYVLLSGIGGYSMLILLFLASIAVIGYFARRRALESSRWRTVIAPALAAAGLLVGLILGTTSFTILISGGRGLATLLILILYGVFALGVVLAVVYKRSKPDTYARIGRDTA
ncbi:APC family permease [Nocardia jiangxiensis]|nr:APC family permease [Nocardia jiangxiensis]